MMRDIFLENCQVAPVQLCFDVGSVRFKPDSHFQNFAITIIFSAVVTWRCTSTMVTTVIDDLKQVVASHCQDGWFLVFCFSLKP